MKIVDVLKLNDEQIRVDNGSRWLVCDDDGTFIVYERKMYAKSTTTIIETKNEDAAVAALVGQFNHKVEFKFDERSLLAEDEIVDDFTDFTGGPLRFPTEAGE